MQKLVIFIFVLYLCQNASAYCCFRDPYMLPTSPCTSMCGSGNSCANIGSNSCNCGVPCKCYRDPDNVCNVCDPPSPVCQCLSSCGCGCPKYPIYFPEVEYPATIIEMNPFYYKTCFCA